MFYPFFPHSDSTAVQSPRPSLGGLDGLDGLDDWHGRFYPQVAFIRMPSWILHPDWGFDFFGIQVQNMIHHDPSG